MKKLQFKQDIKAPAKRFTELCWDSTARQHIHNGQGEFNSTSDFEDSWDKGSKIYFTGTDEKGKKGGMVSEIADNIAGKFVSIRHYGILDGDH